MSYELWDTETRNIVETFESEADALQAARELIALNPPTYPGALALVFEDHEGTTTVIGRGAALTGLCSQQGEERCNGRGQTADRASSLKSIWRR